MLSGHIHVPSTALLAGVPVWTGGPIHTTVDALPPSDVSLRLFATPSISRIDLFEDTVVATAVPLAAAVLTRR